MKTRSALKSGALLGMLLCLGATPDAQQTVEPLWPAAVPGQRRDVRAAASTSATNQLARANRATGLIGINVLNHNGEFLGRIRDVVFDLRNGRVVYCVLGVDQGLWQRERYHAVPMTAFQASPTNEHLVLWADKQRLMMAEGFDRHNWPGPDGVSFSETLWRGPGAADNPASVPSND